MRIAILSQINSVTTRITYFLKVHLNIILTLMNTRPDFVWRRKPQIGRENVALFTDLQLNSRRWRVHA
jgi:hypothetical protein